MSNSGILLSLSAFKSLSPGAQGEILTIVGLSGAVGHRQSVPVLGAEPTGRVVADEDGPVELTVAMVRKLTANLSDKTINALRVIAQSSSPEFHMKEVIETTKDAETYMDVRGIWSALTRRTRNITDDKTAALIWWMGEEILDGNEKYVDHIGRVSSMTHSSLRTHFGL